ncbi:PAS domain S-box protein [Archaeoglobus fulgidus]|uniref:PAS domain S-box protein n=1 Tax=Archaeoglobus fulgidus TaxID=2234 RepID=UPI000B34C5A8|nr:PAS domain S-box protein [Archaeoglobus fulgidus]
MNIIISNEESYHFPGWKIIHSMEEFSKVLQFSIEEAKINLEIDWAEAAELSAEIKRKNPACKVEFFESDKGEFSFLKSFLERIKYPAVIGRFVGEEPVIVYANQSFVDLFGNNGRFIVGDYLDKLIVPPEKHEEALDLNRRVKEGEVVFVEVKRATKTGERYFELTALPFSRKYAVAIYRDITKRREAMQKIVESERKYRGVFDTSFEPMVLLDGSFSIIEVNKAFEEEFGVSGEELKGKNIREILDIDPSLEESEIEALVGGRRKIMVYRIKKINSEILLSIKDITEFEATSRLLRAITYANDLIVRVDDREELFEQSVKLLADIGKESSCWIGMLSNGEITKVYCEGCCCAVEITTYPKCFEEVLRKKKALIVTAEDRDEDCPFYTKKPRLCCIIAPLIINGDVIGFNVLHSPIEFSEEMKEFFESVTNNIAIKAKAIEADKAKKIAFKQIEDNIIKLAGNQQ